LKVRGARVPHIIDGNKSGASPQTWVVVDTETLPIQLDEHRWQHVFRLGVIAIWRRGRETKKDTVEYRRYSKPSDLVHALATLPKSKERVGIVAHNLDYDAQVLDIHTRLRAEHFNLTRAVIEKGKWVQRWQAGGKKEGTPSRTLLLVDLGNFFPFPLRELALRVGMRKGSLPDFDESDEKWFRYCEHDVKIELALLQRWLQFCETNDLGYWAPTIAGQAFNAYRHRFMHYQIFVHVHDDVIGLERAAYYGGRCEPFWRGRAPRQWYAHLDINSNYGGIMYDERLPTKQVGHYGPMSPRALERILETHQACALVTVSTDAPAFPLRTPKGVVYPLGVFSTALASPELALALSYGYVRDVHEVVTYEHSPIFKDYAAFFWNLRLDARGEKDEFMAKVCKQFLAALHGKFGQRIVTSRLIVTGADREDEIWTEYDVEDSEWNEYRSIAGRVEQRVREVNGRDTLVAIPAHIASYARVKLWNLMLGAGISEVFYVDTDSLIVTRKGLDRLRSDIQPHDLGGLRLVNESDQLYIRAPKWYSFGRERKRAGISYAARAIEWDQFEQDRFRSTRWALTHDFAGAAIVEEVKVNAPYHKLLLERQLGHRITGRLASEYA